MRFAPELQEVSKRAQSDMTSLASTQPWSSNRASVAYWRAIIVHGVTENFLMLVPTNASLINSFSAVTLARYIHEAGIWVRLVDKQREYALVFFDQLLNQQQQQWSDHCSNTRLEANLLRARFEMC
jgi:hypothetical protein